MWNNDRFQATDLDGLASLRQADDIFAITQFSNNTVWAYSDRRVLSRQPDSDWREHVIQPMNPGRINSLGELADGTVYLCGIGNVLRLDTVQAAAASMSAPGVAMRKIILRSDEGVESSLAVDGRHLVMPDRTYSLAFEYAADQLPSPLAMQYQTMLSGPLNFDNDWDQSTRLSYADLPPGSYRLQIRARSGNGESRQPVAFTFEVQPQWYETSWAKLFWLLLALSTLAAASAGFTRWRLARLHADRRRLQYLIHEQTAELATANRKLENMAHVDALTGIANRRQLDRYLPDAAQRCITNKKALGLILIDVDHFKQFNDQFGHQRGDELLRQLADLLILCLRRTDDILARYGGEEFIAVLPGADADMVLEVAERMRSSVESSDLGITMPAGLVSKVPDTLEHVHELIGDSDKRLYRAKEQGRNQVVSD
ncbi:GGDEF domain-containing protein [Gammaproteobacteria bacterium LSUCC0112]|nr:GGDEF domain-containing protein [Gammaproteobacteria bacterium LSUCC0112]